ATILVTLGFQDITVTDTLTGITGTVTVNVIPTPLFEGGSPAASSPLRLLAGQPAQSGAVTILSSAGSSGLSSTPSTIVLPDAAEEILSRQAAAHVDEYFATFNEELWFSSSRSKHDAFDEHDPWRIDLVPKEDLLWN